ncbi:beta-ketoacyl synthase N-terminal-like domain-containing protein [Bacillus nakamurai]|uniref:beta-ketoacyl synthase N-terminal-like domain-containing protein n=1 Tax=Bacillus nakamurai TaxID=1793963 RepID=UPI0020C5702D|nr:beta-ketoacyl synthase N-terminal-like domain-containing protein [Bacillus nakamurai]MCP6681309.1 thioesterase domain-containing protein [Bacillus nakamurai]
MQNTEDLLYKLLAGQLKSIGFFTENNTQPVLQDFYGRWLEESISILVRNGFLKQSENTYVLTKPIERADVLWKEWDEKKTPLLKDSNKQAMIILVETALRALPDILSGRVSATDILFPDSSMNLVEGIYKNNTTADYFNEVLADTLTAFIEERVKQDPSAEVRILEIGAGTGGTSAAVFQRLKAYKHCVKEYCYTDLSKAFLMHAEKEYGPDNPYLTYKRFNVEEPPVLQEIEAGAYDAVIAANVLHATKNIRKTLRNAKAVLKKNGILLLNEISSHSVYSHLTFGLLEGWWLYEDAELRIPVCPGLYPEAWQKVLEAEGFRYVTFMAESSHKLGQQIVAAESDGVIRQKQPDVQAAPEIAASAEQVGASELGLSITDQTVQFIKETLAKSIKLSPERIHVETSFEKYGIDSILQVNFIRELEALTGELPKTILFEHTNTKELAAYLLENFPDKLQKAFVTEQAPPEKKKTAPIIKKETPPVIETRRFIKEEPKAPKPEPAAVSARSDCEDIAIIGISGRYPLSDTLDELWEHLQAGDSCITEAPEKRWQTSLLKTLAKETSGGGGKKRYGGFLQNIDAFDHHLFEINEAHVMEMTPELRLSLETVWETFENGGYSLERLNKWQETEAGIGVFMGSMYNQYFWNIPSLEQAALSSNGGDWHIANRISHYFNLTGPSMGVTTACSSSLSAVHLACESLKLNSCSMAIAGGVNLTLEPSKYDALERANLLEKGSESKSFGTGTGLMPGEGVGAVLLKPLSKAIADKDHIYGVIKSSALCHSGGRQMYTAPDPKQQAKLMAASIDKAGIDPETISYVESAANGSVLGDPIEVIALTNAFSQYTDKKQFCALGSVKSNLGHLEAASGMSQLTKVLLQMDREILVPTINASPQNPNITLDQTAFYLQEQTEHWERLKDSETGDTLPRRSMINSFGAGGAYANLIVEEYISPDCAYGADIGPEEYLIPVSAKTKWSLEAFLDKLLVFLEKTPSHHLAGIASALQKRTHHTEYRAAFTAASVQELVKKLTAYRMNPKTDVTSSSEIGKRARQWAAGETVIFDQEQKEHFIHLPNYAFDHRTAFHFGDTESESDVYRYDEPYVKGHQFNGEQVLVGATYGSLAADAFYDIFPEAEGGQISKLNYVSPVTVQKGDHIELKTESSPNGPSVELNIMYRSRTSRDWKQAAYAECRPYQFQKKSVDVKAIQQSYREMDHIEDIYGDGTDAVRWGEEFKAVTRLFKGNGAVLARLSLNRHESLRAHDYAISPFIANSAYLAILSLLDQSDAGSFLPFGINSIQFSNQTKLTDCWLHITLAKHTGEMILFNADVINDAAETVIRYEGYSLKRFRTAAGQTEQPVRPDPNCAGRLSAGSLTDDIRRYVTGKLAGMMSDPAASPRVDANMMDLGIDSARLIGLTKEIEHDAKIDVNPTLFFEYPTIEELTGYFASEYEAEFSQLLDHEQQAEERMDTQTKALPEEKHEGQQNDAHKKDGMAIIGMSGQFPQSSDIQSFWKHVVNGDNCVTEIPEERWDWRRYGADEDKSSLRWGGFIYGIGEFDPLFFGISPKEASQMSPEQFLLLTHTWKAMEDAGLTSKALSNRPTGVFVAAGNSDPNNGAAIPSIIPNRISYTLNLHGPSEYYEAACSSTLVALHRAIQAIRNHECEQAVVGAANVLLSPKGYLGFDSMGYLSKEGQAKSFQNEADGFVRSEGAGVFIIKPLQKAIEDGDRIYMVIKGTGVSHGGKGMSLHAPNPAGMKAAMKKAYEGSDVDPRTVTYVEAHGIASQLADAIEFNALKAGYSELEGAEQSNQEDQPCYISSLKPCIGHGELASGMAALMKVAMAMKENTIPGIPGFTAVNDQIPIQKSRFRLTKENHEWRQLTDHTGRQIPRRAAINSYGFGGINAHVILEQYSPSPKEAERQPEPQLIVLSAKSEERLKAAAHQMADFVEKEDVPSFRDLAYTLQTGRDAMNFRLALVVRNQDELLQGLKDYAEVSEVNGVLRSSVPGFLGSQKTGLGDLGALLEGTLGDVVMETLLAENNLEKLAFCWVGGADIPWDRLHQGRHVQKISLPTYPFEKNKCWRGFETEDIEVSPAAKETASKNEGLLYILADILGMDTADIDPQKPLTEYGFDSISCIQFLQKLEASADRRISLEALQTCSTLEEMTMLAAADHHEASSRDLYRKFPELVQLNEREKGRPVFWFHGGTGGVEAYQPFAKKSQRPFYGIQAKGFMTGEAPLEGIEEMAAYYMDIIQVVQPKGPYDLGGYSLGGMLAYETARLLQEAGHAVKSIVMVDTPYSTKWKETKPSLKSVMLQTVNTMLTAFLKPEKPEEALISRKEIDVQAEEEDFLKELIGLAKKRGLPKSEDTIRMQVEQMINTQLAYGMEEYTIKPLPHPEALQCYYFRNKSGLFLGGLERYLTIQDDQISLDHEAYWEEWERHMKQFHLLDVHSSSHVMMLSETKPQNAIKSFCEKLYANKGTISANFLKSFRKKLEDTNELIKR